MQNLYGPTEAAIDVTAHRVTVPVPPRVTIGGPVPGASLYVLDAGRRPQPVGVAGELFIGGVQVARGYQGRPGLTAERFTPHPFVPGARLYATGDQARWRADGSLDYLGRLDHQVKIRGYRVEPGEVEAALLRHPGVAAAIVLARPDRLGDLQLHAYVVATGTEPTDLRDHLTVLLPTAMIPAAYHWLDALPLLVNGKVDRKALAALTVDRAPAKVSAEPVDLVERKVARIWSDVLGVSRVGRGDNFFELGGHSLLAVRVIGRVRADFGIELTVVELLTGSATVAGVSEIIRQREVDATEATELSRLMAALDSLTDDEVRQRLAQVSE